MLLRRGAHIYENSIIFILLGGFTLLRRGLTFLKGGSRLIKKYYLHIIGAFTLFRGGFNSNNYILYNYLICFKQNLIPTINVLPSHLTNGQLVTAREQSESNVQTVAISDPYRYV